MKPASISLKIANQKRESKHFWREDLRQKAADLMCDNSPYAVIVALWIISSAIDAAAELGEYSICISDFINFDKINLEVVGEIMVRLESYGYCTHSKMVEDIGKVYYVRWG